MLIQFVEVHQWPVTAGRTLDQTDHAGSSVCPGCAGIGRKTEEEHQADTVYRSTVFPSRRGLPAPSRRSVLSLRRLWYVGIQGTYAACTLRATAEASRFTNDDHANETPGHLRCPP